MPPSDSGGSFAVVFHLAHVHFCYNPTRSRSRILFNGGSNRKGTDEQELTIFIIRKLKEAIKCGRGIYNPELNRMLPPKALDPAVLTRMAIARVIFTYRGWLFFNPEFMHWTEERILSYLKHQDHPPGFDESCSCGK